MPPVSNYPMDRATYKVVKGVQNEILFLVRNIDRKPAGSEYFQTLTMNIVDPDTETTLLSRALSVIDPVKGIYQLALLPGDTPNWPLGWLRWSITVTRYDNTSVMLWTDLGYSPYGTLEVFEAPNPQPASTKTLQSGDLMILTDSNTYTSPLPGAALDGFSNGMQTFTCALTNFIGSITVQASLAAQPDSSANSADWFDVSTSSYTSATSGTQALNAQGSFVWTRLKIAVTSGSIDQVDYKN